MSRGTCRACDAPLEITFCDLGLSPLSNSYVLPNAIDEQELRYPLHAYVCGTCFLVQLEEFVPPENIFSDYAYFSSYSSSWLEHAKRYTHSVIERFGINSESLVVEVASNDGYLLRNFLEKGIPVLGIEPAENVSEAARRLGIKTLTRFFSSDLAAGLAAEGARADLIVANNVLAHVPNLNDFISGLVLLLKPKGVITIEFPHLLRLIQGNQFDTIYHEHFSYFSLLTIETVFDRHGLRIFDVEELETHGGSLRIYLCHQNDDRIEEPAVSTIFSLERRARLDEIQTYKNFGVVANQAREKLVNFLTQARMDGKMVVGYGAPAKGNTLLNFCNIGADLLAYTVDISPHKQGVLLPGSRIPVFGPEKIFDTKPDYILILPWNLKEEIVEQMSGVQDWGCNFVLPIPEVRILL